MKGNVPLGLVERRAGWPEEAKDPLQLLGSAAVVVGKLGCV